MDAKRRESLVAEIFRIFAVNNLSEAEIKYIIFHNSNEYSEGIHEASNQIANLFLKEELSIEEGKQLFNKCQEQLQT